MKRDTAVNFAVVGCGGVSRFHIESILALSQTRLVGVTDALPPVAERTAARYHTRAYPDTDAVLADPNVDALCICVPSFLHARLALAAIRAGKHVLIEKPLAITPQDCAAIISEAADYHVLAAVVSQYRFSDAVRQAKTAIDSRRLGRLLRGDLYMKYFRPQSYYDSARWRGTREMDGGGALMNQGIHGLDLLRYLMGPAACIYAEAATLARHIEVEDTLSAVIRFRSGALGVVEASTADYPGSPRRIEINGEKGTIVLEEGHILLWQEEGCETFHSSGSSRSSSSQNDPLKLDMHYPELQIANFAEAILGKQDLATPAFEGKLTLDWIFAAYQSAELGFPIKL